jgi:hypothetical protein
MEKRRHKRFSLTGTATLQLEDGGDNKSIEGVLGSISSVGMGLYAHNPIEANKQVSIAISFISIGGGVKDTIIEGRVVYSKDLGKIHFVGIQFNEAVTSNNQPLLSKHIENILAFE